MPGFLKDKHGKNLTDHSGTLMGVGMRVVVYREGRGLSEAVITKYNPQTDQVGLELVGPIGKREMRRFSTPYWAGKFHVPANPGPEDDVRYDDRDTGFKLTHNPLYGWRFINGRFVSKSYDTLDELIAAL